MVPEPHPTLFLVDDDPDMHFILLSAGVQLGLFVEAYRSPGDFLAAYDRNRWGCLVLDLMLPGMTGLELQRNLKQRHICLPLVMISGHANVAIAVEAMRQGAYSFLEKPFQIEELVDTVRAAIDDGAKKRGACTERAEARRRLGQLTLKEKEVVTGILAGKSNKEIAAELYLSVRAVEDRRARALKKLGVASVAELVALVQTARLSGRL